MQLVMAIGNTVVDNIEVKPGEVKDPVILRALTLMLEENNWLTVAAYQKEPVFYLQVPSLVS